MDVDVKAEIPAIKTEDGDMPAEDDAFEDDTDLQFPEPGSQAWLVKVPKELWTAWKTLYDAAPDDEPIEIGKLRVYEPKEGEEQPDVLKQKLEISLEKGLREYKDVPTRFDVTMKTSGYSNTVVFSEKDLPGHRQRYRKREQMQQGRRGGTNKYDRYGRPIKPGSYRTSIPKQVALAPIIQHEAVAQASHDAAVEQLSRNWKNVLQPRSQTLYTSRLDTRLHPGANVSGFSTFVTTSKPSAKAGKKKPVKEKAVRMSEDALMDSLSQCFKQFEYWRMSSLRASLQQPEAWIKAVLEKVGFLIRSGPFAMCWHLKDEFAFMGSAEAKREEANIDVGPEEYMSGAETGATGGTGDEDEGGDFEDVKME